MAYSIGDLAQSFVMNARVKALKSQQTLLTKELTTGQVAQLRKALNGDLNAVSSLSRTEKMSAEYARNSREAAFTASSMQSALGVVAKKVQGLFDELPLATISATTAPIESAGRTAENLIDSMVSALNSEVAGRFVFSGQTTDTPPLESAQAIKDGVVAAVAGLTDAEDIRMAVEAYFAPGGDFETINYLGSATDVSGVQIGTGETVSLAIKANDPALRETLSAAALVFVASRPGSGLAMNVQQDVISSAQNATLGAKDSLVDLRGTLGAAEARIEDALVRAQTAEQFARKSKTNLVAVDQFDVATRLEQTRSQLEFAFATTARLRSISLLEYMR